MRRCRERHGADHGCISRDRLGSGIFRGKVDEPTFCQIALGCGRVLASMQDELLSQIFARFPDLEAESRRRAQAALTTSKTREVALEVVRRGGR
jgi:hypothetical protein